MWLQAECSCDWDQSIAFERARVATVSRKMQSFFFSPGYFRSELLNDKNKKQQPLPSVHDENSFTNDESLFSKNIYTQYDKTDVHIEEYSDTPCVFTDGCDI